MNSYNNFDTLSSKQVNNYYQLRDIVWIQHQILRTSQQRNVWSSVRRISFQTLGVRGLTYFDYFLTTATHLNTNNEHL